MQQPLVLVIGTVTLIIVGLFVAIGFVAVPVNNVTRVEYTCICGKWDVSDPFNSYSDCAYCGHRMWWPVLYGTPCDY